MCSPRELSLAEATIARLRLARSYKASLIFRPTSKKVPPEFFLPWERMSALRPDSESRSGCIRHYGECTVNHMLRPRRDG